MDQFLVTLLGRAAVEAWGQMPRDVQEALFEKAAEGHPELRDDLARLLHAHHPRTEHAAGPAQPRV